MIKKKAQPQPQLARPLRKAPLFTTTANRQYMLATSAAMCSLGALLIGVLGGGLAGYYLPGHVADLASVAATPVSAKVVKTQPAPLPTQPADASPHSPEAVAASVSQSPQPAPKSPAERQADWLVSQYQVSHEEAATFVAAAQHAEQRTGLTSTLLLAVAAKTSEFKGPAQAGLLGPMRINAQKRQLEIASVQAQGLTPDSADGNFLIGAMILSRHRNEAGGDMAAALQRYANAVEDKQQGFYHGVISIQKELDTASGAIDKQDSPV